VLDDVFQKRSASPYRGLAWRSHEVEELTRALY